MNTGLHDWYQGWLRLRQSWYCSAEKHCNCRSAMAMVMMVMTMKIKVTMGLVSWTNCRSTWQGKQPALIGYYNAMHHNQKERVGWKFSRNFGGWFHFCHRDSIFPWFNMDWADVFCLLLFLFLQFCPDLWIKCEVLAIPWVSPWPLKIQRWQEEPPDGVNRTSDERYGDKRDITHSGREGGGEWSWEGSSTW